MAAVSTGGVGLGSGVQLHTLKNPVIKNPKPSSLSSFLGKKLVSRFKPFNFTPRSRNLVVFAVGGESFSFLHDVFLGVGVGLPCTVMQCGDIIYRSTLPKSNGLTITVPGVILALSTLSYLWATPGVAPGFFDMFVLAFIERLFRPSFKKVCGQMQ